jgi:hypothetical protein
MSNAVKAPVRNAWEDRFKQPSADDLSAHYNKQLGALFEAARERLSGFDGVTEHVRWQGLPWRWCLRYETEGDPTDAWTYLVPDPAGPILSVPLTCDMIDAMPMKRLKKHVRDGMTFGKRVGDVVWATWQTTNKPQLDEVLDISKRKHKYLVEVKPQATS